MKWKKTASQKRLAAITIMMMLFCSQVLAQAQTIKGMVTDKKGLPLLGVTVLVKEASIEARVKKNWGTYQIILERSVLGKYNYVNYTKVTRTFLKAEAK